MSMTICCAISSLPLILKIAETSRKRAWKWHMADQKPQKCMCWATIHISDSWSIVCNSTPLELIQLFLINSWSWDSSVSIVTDYRLDGRSSVPGRGERFFPSPQHPDQLWGPSYLLFNGYRGLFPWG
jgi:hypothetical protein